MEINALRSLGDGAFGGGGACGRGRPCGGGAFGGGALGGGALGDGELRGALATHQCPAEVTFSGTVTSNPIFFHSQRSGLTHEAFDVRTPSGLQAEVVDNVDIGPRIPVHPGEPVTVRGEYVRDAGATHIVHFTHHDPSGRHAGGFVDAGGRRYA